MHDVDEAPIAWREHGEGDVVLLLHGLGQTRTAWDPQLEALGAHHRAVAWEQPGYGASPAEEHLTFRRLADLAAGLLDRLGAATAHVVGLSMGGMVAQHLALHHPGRVRTLALLSTSPAFGLDGTDPEEWKRLRLDPLDRGEAPADMAERVLRAVGGDGLTADQLAGAVASMARITPAGLRAAVEVLPTHDTRPRLSEISAPTLVVVGERDVETPPSYARVLAEGIPGARLQVVPGAGHLLNAERPGEVSAILLGHVGTAGGPH